MNTATNLQHFFAGAILIGFAFTFSHCTMTHSWDAINNAPQLNKRPSWLQTCPRSNPNKNQCFRNLFEGCFPSLANGLPEIGVKSFDPLLINDVSVSSGRGSLLLSGGFHNLIVRGASNATVRRANLNLEANTLNFELSIPILHIKAKYNLQGNIMLLPLDGRGDVLMDLSNVATLVYTNIHLRKKPEEVIHIDRMKVNFLVGGMQIHLANLFNGNDILGSSINAFLNQNAKEVISELRPDLERGLADIFHGLWNNFFSKIPTKLWLL